MPGSQLGFLAKPCIFGKILRKSVNLAALIFAGAACVDLDFRIHCYGVWWVFFAPRIDRAKIWQLDASA